MTYKHTSDCGTNNEPALRNTKCDCEALKLIDKIEEHPFESTGGDLINCAEWRGLKDAVRDLRRRLFVATCIDLGETLKPCPNKGQLCACDGTCKQPIEPTEGIKFCGTFKAQLTEPTKPAEGMSDKVWIQNAEGSLIVGRVFLDGVFHDYPDAPISSYTRTDLAQATVETLRELREIDKAELAKANERIEQLRYYVSELRMALEASVTEGVGAEEALALVESAGKLLAADGGE